VVCFYVTFVKISITQI